MEEEVVDVVGPRSKPDPARSAYRHGHEQGEATLGGRVLPVERPRVRRVDGSGEVELATYRHFADRDPLDRVVLERTLAGVSCRRYPRTQEPVREAVERDLPLGLALGALAPLQTSRLQARRPRVAGS